MLFKAVAIPSDEPVQYVGVYVLKWGEVARHIMGQPTMGFVPVEEDILTKFANLCREYPNEPADVLLDMALGYEEE